MMMVMVMIVKRRNVTFRDIMLRTARKNKFRRISITDWRLQILMMMVMMKVHIFLFNETHNIRSTTRLFRFPLACLNAIFSHCKWAINAMKFKI